jgi:hypothetical protein
MDFSAVQQWIGNHYQVKWGLFRLLELSDLEAKVYIEADDDVVSQVKNSSFDYDQLKYHKDGAGNLTDKSPDLWKTLRIWVHLLGSDDTDAQTVFTLVTTSPIKAGSALSWLGEFARNIDEAVDCLDKASNSCENESCQPGITAYNKLLPDAKKALLARVYVIQQPASIASLRDKIKRLLITSTDPKRLPALLTRVEEWWGLRVEETIVRAADQNVHEPITFLELIEKVDEIRKQLTEDNLPLDDHKLEIDELISSCKEKRFIKQIAMFDIDGYIIRPAVEDYYESFYQVSRWTRDGLLKLNELSNYQKILIREWELCIGFCWRSIKLASSEDKKEMASRLYQMVMSKHLPIRPQVCVPYIMRGNFHMLANDSFYRIKWHPDFESVPEI